MTTSADPLIAAMLVALRREGGFVVVDGREMVDKRVLRKLLAELTAKLVAGMRDALAPEIARHPDGEAIFDGAARRIEERLAAILPVLN